MALAPEELEKAAINLANAATFLRQARTPICHELAEKVDALALAIADARSEITS